MPPTLLSPTWPQWGGEPSVRGSGTHTGALDSSASGLPGIKPPAPGMLVALPPCTLPWRFLPTLLLPSCSPRTAFQGCLQGPTEQQLCKAASWSGFLLHSQPWLSPSSSVPSPQGGPAFGSPRMNHRDNKKQTNSP